MKKPLLVAATLALLGSPAFAQMADNSICPDWTGTDLNGTTHNLYALLDSGYTVFIDVSATWCGPCWSYHNSGALETLYEDHGPGTTDNKVRVFMIEGDNSTSLADLQGNTGQTQGNWINGTPYPIIDNASIANLLEITYFPTIYKVCPNRIITEVGQKTAAQLWTSAGTCQAAEQPLDASLLPLIGEVAGCAGSDVGLTARLQNMGTSPLTSATIEARQGQNVLGSTTWTGSLDTYAVTNVDVASFVPTGNTSITLAITTTDANMANNTSSMLVKASTLVAAGTSVALELKCDNYGSETRWKLYRPDGTVFAQGGPYTNGNTQVQNYNWNLEDFDCYHFEITDGYGDGMCCSYGQGYYKLSVGGTVFAQGGSFGSVESKYFNVNSLAGVSDNMLDRSLKVYPNPSTGQLNVEYNLEQGAPVHVAVTDMVGKVVLERTIRPMNGAQTQTLDLKDLSNGMYLLKLDAGNHQATRVITLNK